MDRKFADEQSATGSRKTSDSASRRLSPEKSSTFSAEPPVDIWLSEVAPAGSDRSAHLKPAEGPDATGKCMDFPWPEHSDDECGPKTLLPSQCFQWQNQLNQSDTRQRKGGESCGIGDSPHSLITAQTESSFGYFASPKLIAQCKMTKADHSEHFFPFDRSEKDWETLVLKLNKAVQLNINLQEQLQAAQTNEEDLKRQLYAAKNDKSAADEKLNDLIRNNRRLSSLIQQYQGQAANALPDANQYDSSLESDEETDRHLQHSVEMALYLQKELDSMRVVIERQTQLINQLQQQQKLSVHVTHNTASSAEESKKPSLPTFLESARPVPINADVKSTTLDPQQVLFYAAGEPSVSKSIHQPQPLQISYWTSTARFEVPKNAPPKSDTMECHQRPPVPQRTNRQKTPIGLSHTSLVKKQGSINSCPICSKPIPSASPGDYTRHVGECLSKVKREPAQPRSHLTPETLAVANNVGKCPVCSKTFPAELSEGDRTWHVNSHFDEADQFVLLN